MTPFDWIATAYFVIAGFVVSATSSGLHREGGLPGSRRQAILVGAFLGWIILPLGLIRRWWLMIEGWMGEE